MAEAASCVALSYARAVGENLAFEIRHGLEACWVATFITGLPISDP